MKIGIYGDSFACIHTKWVMSKSFNHHLGLSWVELLEEAGHDITNFAQSGSAFMFSYKKFLKNYKDFDLNIFVVTNWSRIYIEKLPEILIHGSPSCDVEYDRIMKSPNYKEKDEHIKILKSLKTYMEIWADWDMVKHTQQVLCQNIFNICPNTILIPVFEDSLIDGRGALWNACLHELFLCDERAYNKFDFLNLDCQRKCHFSEENNEVLAKEVLAAIDQKKQYVGLDLSLLKKPSKDFNFYVRQTVTPKLDNFL